jgi:hypothetical protein
MRNAYRRRCPDEAERNPGMPRGVDAAPDFATLHPGYACYAAFAPFSAIPTNARKIPVAPLSRASAPSHSSKNTTFWSGRTRAPSG